VEKEAWDVVDVARLREAADPAASADVAVLLVTEGLANLQVRSPHTGPRTTASAR
jgi:protein pelota